MPESTSEGKVGKRNISEGAEAPKVEGVARKQMEASAAIHSGPKLPSDKMLSAAAKATFIFQRKIALEKLGRTGAAVSDLRGRVARFEGELDTTPKVKEIWAASIEWGTQRIANFSSKMISLLNKERPEMGARAPKDWHFAQQGVIIVANGTVIPEGAPGILMTEDQYAERVTFLKENIVLSKDSRYFRKFVRRLLVEIITWEGGLDFLKKSTQRTGKLPLIQRGPQWGCYYNDRHIEINRKQKLLDIPFRTIDGKPFKGKLSEAICLAHEISHTMDPNLTEEDFKDKVMWKVWLRPTELRAVTLANFFRKNLLLGQRSVYHGDLNIPLYSENIEGGGLLSKGYERLDVHEIAKHARLHYNRAVLLKSSFFYLKFPSDMTVEELGAAISSLSLEEWKHIKSIHILGNKLITALPRNIAMLSGLVELSLRGCSSLRSLPKGFSQLDNLRRLDLHGCKSLVEILPHLRASSKLEYLDLSGCSSLTDIPKKLQKKYTSTEEIEKFLELLPKS